MMIMCFGLKNMFMGPIGNDCYFGRRDFDCRNFGCREFGYRDFNFKDFNC